MTLQNIFFFFFLMQERASQLSRAESLTKRCTSSFPFERKCFFHVQSCKLVPVGNSLLRACLSLKRFAGSALLANCLGRESIHQKEFFFYYSLKSVSKQNSAALVEKAFLFSGFFMLWRAVISPLFFSLTPCLMKRCL